MLGKINFILLATTLFLSGCASGGRQSKRIPIFKSLLENPEDSFNHVVEHLEKDIAFEYFSKKEIRKKVKQWNPHIKNWSEINARTPIYLYKRSFKSHLALGYYASSYQEKLKRNELLKTESGAIGLDFMGDKALSMNTSLVLHLSLRKQEKFTSDQEKIPLKEDYAFDLLLEHTLAPSNFYFNIGAGVEQKNVVGVDRRIDTTINKIQDSLYNNTYSYTWGETRFRYQRYFLWIPNPL